MSNLMTLFAAKNYGCCLTGNPADAGNHKMFCLVMQERSHLWSNKVRFALDAYRCYHAISCRVKSDFFSVFCLFVQSPHSCRVTRGSICATSSLHPHMRDELPEDIARACQGLEAREIQHDGSQNRRHLTNGIWE